MKMKIRSAALLALSAALLLTACGSTKETAQGTAGTASGSTSADSKTAEVSKNEDNGANASNQANSGSTGIAEVDLSDGQEGGAEAAGDTGDAGNVSPEDTFDAMNQSGEGEATASAGINWQGTYSSDSGETLTITVSDEHTIAFSFAVSGISGTADKDGNEAIYNGDDNVQVIFEHFDSSLSVTVLNPEGGVEESTVSGSYSRQ